MNKYQLKINNQDFFNCLQYVANQLNLYDKSILVDIANCVVKFSYLSYLAEDYEGIYIEDLENEVDLVTSELFFILYTELCQSHDELILDDDHISESANELLDILISCNLNSTDPDFIDELCDVFYLTYIVHDKYTGSIVSPSVCAISAPMVVLYV